MDTFVIRPDGFLRHRRNERRIRQYLIDRLGLDPAVEDVDDAAHRALARLPYRERDQFQGDWIAMLLEADN